MKASRALVFAISGIVVLVVCGYAYLKYVFWEPSGVERDSFVYQLKIPEFAKNYPVWNEVGQPLYDLRIADGEKPSLVKVYYTSRLAIVDLVSQINQLGYHCTKPEDKNVLCTNGGGHGERYEVSLKEINSGTEVTVDIIGGYQ